MAKYGFVTLTIKLYGTDIAVRSDKQKQVADNLAAIVADQLQRKSYGRDGVGILKFDVLTKCGSAEDE